MRVHGAQELFDDVLAKGLCIGCGACVGLCPYFENRRGKTSRVFACDLDRGRCHAYCPQAEVDLEALAQRMWGQPYADAGALGKYLEVKAARAGERLRGGTFQDGGAVTALVCCALESGLVEAVALTDSDKLVPLARLVTGTGEVMECSGTKYAAAPTLAALNRAIRDGRDRLGVVATPCQATAVAQLRNDPLDEEGFTDPVALVIGLFCTWALDARGLIDFLSRRMDISRISGITVPPPPAGVLVVRGEGDSEQEVPLDDIRPLIPEACGVCTDMTAQWSDLSLGALEGRKGWNTLIVRSERGRGLVERALAEGWLEVDEMPPGSLEHLAGAARDKRRKALAKAREKGLLDGGDGARPLLRIDGAAVQAIIEGREET